MHIQVMMNREFVPEIIPVDFERGRLRNDPLLAVSCFCCFSLLFLSAVSLCCFSLLFLLSVLILSLLLAQQELGISRTTGACIQLQLAQQDKRPEERCRNQRCFARHAECSFKFRPDPARSQYAHC
jgi:hypothetical protein